MKSLNITIVIVSDTRSEETDTSGKKLRELIQNDGHKIVNKIIVKENKIIEIGPNKVLSGLIKRISNSFDIVSINKVLDLK